MTGPIPRPGVLDIEPYQGGKSKDTSYVGKMSSNEAALGPSPKALEAYRKAEATLQRYPDGGAHKLREAIARHHDVEFDRVVCGFGSDDLLQLLARGYAGPGDEVLYSEHGFLIYPIAARAVGAEPVAARDDGYTVSVDAMLAAVTERTKIVFIANPNNPTGTYIPATELERLHAGLPEHVVLVVDAAYAEFVTDPAYDSGQQLASWAPNVIMTRTFSKVYGLAALRVGWAYGAPGIVDVLNRLRGPFNVAAPAQAAAVAALDDREFLEKALAHNSRWRDWLFQRLGGLGLDVVPSAGNFLLIGFGSTERARAADAYLQDKGWYLRRMDSYGFTDHLRLTVGTEAENRGVTDVLAAFMGQARV
ncbi:histidinol-phosphate transaminase [Iodidimonas sp. SYSU 1G8]|uniref:histidinol-phosphate transaminase n=1 Tax=Iodidimonas sp. SYSU 1G8 TaxID=3133967 RepID=UPI0031FE5A27